MPACTTKTSASRVSCAERWPKSAEIARAISASCPSTSAPRRSSLASRVSRDGIGSAAKARFWAASRPAASAIAATLLGLPARLDDLEHRREVVEHREQLAQLVRIPLQLDAALPDRLGEGRAPQRDLVERRFFHHHGE